MEKTIDSPINSKTSRSAEIPKLNIKKYKKRPVGLWLGVPITAATLSILLSCSIAKNGKSETRNPSPNQADTLKNEIRTDKFIPTEIEHYLADLKKRYERMTNPLQTEDRKAINHMCSQMKKGVYSSGFEFGDEYKKSNPEAYEAATEISSKLADSISGVGFFRVTRKYGTDKLLRGYVLTVLDQIEDGKVDGEIKEPYSIEQRKKMQRIFGNPSIVKSSLIRLISSLSETMSEMHRKGKLESSESEKKDGSNDSHVPPEILKGKKQKDEEIRIRGHPRKKKYSYTGFDYHKQRKRTR